MKLRNPYRYRVRCHARTTNPISIFFVFFGQSWLYATIDPQKQTKSRKKKSEKKKRLTKRCQVQFNCDQTRGGDDTIEDRNSSYFSKSKNEENRENKNVGRDWERRSFQQPFDGLLKGNPMPGFFLYLSRPLFFFLRKKGVHQNP